MSKNEEGRRPPENVAGAAFSDRARMIVITIGIISLVATIATLVFGRQLAPHPAQPRDSYGRGPLGHRAWLETMRELDLRVVRWTQPNYADVSAPLFFIEPSRAETTVGDQTLRIADVINERIEAGRMTVLVLPKWHPGMLGFIEPDLASDVRQVIDGTPLGQAQVRRPVTVSSDRVEIDTIDGALGARHLELPWPQTLADATLPNATIVLDGPDGTFIAGDSTSRFFVISDPDLLHNFDVQRGDHAALLHDFVTNVLHADTIVVDELFHEHVETRTLSELFAHFPGVLALAHGALVIVIVLLMGRRRFGPPAQEPAPYGRGPQEVIDVAAGVLSSGEKVERLAPRYVEHVILDTHRRLGLSEGKNVTQKAIALDAIATRRGLTPDAERLLGTAGGASRETALAIARRANLFRASLLGSRAAAPKRAPKPSAATTTNEATASTSPSTSTNRSPSP